MQAAAMQIAMSADPFEIVLRREDDLVIAAIVEVMQRFAVDQQFERLDIRGCLADLKHHVQVRPDEMKLGKPCVLVVFVKLEEILLERAVVEQIKLTFVKQTVVAKSINGKHVCQFRDLFQAHVHVVAKDEQSPTGTMSWGVQL